MNSADKAQGNPSVRSEQKNKHIILAEVVFGDPKDARCNGVGICRLLPNNLHRSPHIPSVPAALFFRQSGAVELRLQRADLPDAVYRKQFAGGLFHVRTPLPLPRWLQRKIPAHAPLVISSGVYDFRETGSCLTVLLF